MATDPLPTYPHIVSTPGVRAGKPCIQGTRIAVVDIVAAVRSGYRPEELTEHFSTRPLTLAEIHSALAYGYDHAVEMDAYFARQDEAEAGLTNDPRTYLRSLRP